MIRLKVINHARSCYGAERCFNPSTILMVSDGTENIGGVHYVEILFSAEVRELLPKDRNGLVAVEGKYRDIIQIIEEGSAK